MGKRTNIKAQKKDVVMHLGEYWTVKDRVYDSACEQSFYQLGTGRGRGAIRKWVRSDNFVMA